MNIEHEQMALKGTFMTGRFLACTLLVVALGFGCKEKTREQNKQAKEQGEQTKTESRQAKMVKLKTNMGDIVIELNEQAAPVTAKNFLRYAEEGFYDGAIFHRVIPNFMIQGGGFTAQMARKETRPPIVNEAKNGLKNDRGTIAMARTNNPDSATSQFFINHKNNDFLNYVENKNPGYAVFGRVIEGMDIVDAIAVVKTTTQKGMGDVPVEPVVIKSVEVTQDN
jgi:cyclophilin family peptidyl-prolyl cis-trans isomerase